MKANVKYKLSQAGQKAALMAGRTATSTVTESMDVEDTALLDQLKINPDGSMSYDRSMWGWPDLDAPPSDLASLIATMDAHSAAKRAEEEAKEQEQEEKARIKAERSYPIVEKLLAEFESLPLDAPLPAGIREVYNGFADVDSRGTDDYYLVATPEQSQRRAKRMQEREQHAAAFKAAAEAEREAALTKMIAEHGGILWPVEGGMCSFSGRGLWASGQSKRWVGVFTQPKGIDYFLDSPRGEHSFSVAGLQRGDCIQGAGFDTNSRGKRRYETEWFGVVVRCDENEIVIDLRDSRSSTLKAAAKLKAAA